MKETTLFYYLAPDAEVVEVAVEHGFEVSSNTEDPVEKPSMGWNN